LEHKRKLEAIQAESDAKNKKLEVKLEKLQSELESMKSMSGAKSEEIADLQSTIENLRKENAVIIKKAEKFSEAASEAVTLKEKLTLVKQ